MAPDSGGMGDTSTGGTKDGKVRSSLTNEGSNSTAVGATNLNAMGYNMDVDETDMRTTNTGFPIGKYIVYLLAVLVVLSILLFML